MPGRSERQINKYRSFTRTPHSLSGNTDPNAHFDEESEDQPEKRPPVEIRPGNDHALMAVAGVLGDRHKRMVGEPAP